MNKIDFSFKRGGKYKISLPMTRKSVTVNQNCMHHGRNRRWGVYCPKSSKNLEGVFLITFNLYNLLWSLVNNYVSFLFFFFLSFFKSTPGFYWLLVFLVVTCSSVKRRHILNALCWRWRVSMSTWTSQIN